MWREIDVSASPHPHSAVKSGDDLGAARACPLRRRTGDEGEARRGALAGGHSLSLTHSLQPASQPPGGMDGHRLVRLREREPRGRRSQSHARSRLCAACSTAKGSRAIARRLQAARSLPGRPSAAALSALRGAEPASKLTLRLTSRLRLRPALPRRRRPRRPGGRRSSNEVALVASHRRALFAAFTAAGLPSETRGRGSWRPWSPRDSEGLGQLDSAAQPRRRHCRVKTKADQARSRPATGGGGSVRAAGKLRGARE